MRGYGRGYDDQQRYLGGGSDIHRDRMRHNPSWEDQAYGNRGYDSGFRGGGYGGSRNMAGGDWRSRSYIAREGPGNGGGYNDYGRGDHTYGDFSRQRPMSSRGGGSYDRDMGLRGSQFPRNRGHSGAGGYGMSRGTGYGGTTGMGGYSGGPFANPTDRGDYFLGYGGASRRGYSPYW